MRSSDVQTHCQLKQGCRAVLKAAISDLNFSARAYDRILKVSRTIADLEGSVDIGEEHVLEAVQYRTLDRTMWV